MRWKGLFLVPSPTQAASVSTYPNTPEGLRQLLQDMLIAAKGGAKEKLASFVKDMEIPNCVEWHRKMFDAEKAERAIESCDSKVLNPKEKSLEEQFLRLAKREGDIAIRRVNDHPQPAYSRDWLWLQAIRSPLDIYDATWEAQDRPERFRNESIGNGYFLFIEGGFRWESDAQFMTPKMNMVTFVQMNFCGYPVNLGHNFVIRNLSTRVVCTTAFQAVFLQLIV